jgi:protein-S-isoprenylcysteine O-methyltransferase Ste14
MTLFFYFFIAAYVITIIYEAVETRRHSSDAIKHAKWTLVLFFVVDAATIIGGLIEYHQVENIYFPVSIAGLGLLVIKVILKRVCMRTLGECYNVHIVIGEEHQLIRSGPYKYVRHPAYLAHFLGITGICLMLNAFIMLPVLVTLDLLFLAIRIRIEENELSSRFGHEYCKYRREAWAIIPFKNLLRRDSVG